MHVFRMNRSGVRLVTLACFFGNRNVSNPRRVLEIPIPNQVPTNVNTATLRVRPAWVLPHSAPVARDFYISMVISASQNAPVERMGRTTSKIELKHYMSWLWHTFLSCLLIILKIQVGLAERIKQKVSANQGVGGRVVRSPEVQEI